MAPCASFVDSTSSGTSSRRDRPAARFITAALTVKGTRCLSLSSAAKLGWTGTSFRSPSSAPATFFWATMQLSVVKNLGATSLRKIWRSAPLPLGNIGSSIEGTGSSWSHPACASISGVVFNERASSVLVIKALLVLVFFDGVREIGAGFPDVGLTSGPCSRGSKEASDWIELSRLRGKSAREFDFVLTFSGVISERIVKI
mmetsp:Transcript_40525/g.79284  ORF Transcript_40525/g.79284 Transcript_40525/m.79284 type:complete len:201 (+) Transcript_40525:1088-1690(+)